MPSGALLRCALCALLVLPGVMVPGSAVAAGAPAPTDPVVDGYDIVSTADQRAADRPTFRSSARRTTSITPAESTIEIRLQADGDARFVVATRFRLRTTDDRAAFDSLVQAFTANGSTTGFSVQPFREAAAAATTATGRSMRVTAVDRRTNVTNTTVDGETVTTGTLALTFTWTNFSRVGDGRLFVDDAFNTTDGTWLPRLEADQRLLIRPPPNFLVEDAPFPVRDGVLTADGPRTFTPGELSFTFRRVEPTTTSPTTVTSPPGSDGPPGNGDGLAWLPLLLGAAIAIVAVSLGAYAATRSDDDPDASGAANADAGSGSGPDGGGEVTTGAAQTTGIDGAGDRAGAATQTERVSDESTVGGDEPQQNGTVDPDPDPDPDRGTGMAPGATANGGEATSDADGTDGNGVDTDDRSDGDETGAADDGDGASSVDEALLSDEERVERLLRHNGGRMKQANIVDETGWSSAKVSQLLSGMADDGRVDKLRIGRENLISLPDANGNTTGSDEE